MHCEHKIDSETFMNAPLGFKFRLIHEGFEQIATQELQRLNITYPQMMVLVYLSHNRDHHVTQKELAQALNVSRPTVCGILQRMTDKGLLRQEPDPQNRRCRNVIMEPEGERILRVHQEDKMQTDAFLTRGMTQEEKKSLTLLLTRVRENLAYAADRQRERRPEKC
ncbi:MAG: MarR family winged helix-turn-helix transcriptional regulator [Lachnospiraceae bacterium]